MGNRLKRGLFSSSTHKLLNADLNGVINIMRKCYLRFGLNVTEIKGHHLYNPIRIKSTREVNQRVKALME